MSAMFLLLAGTIVVSPTGPVRSLTDALTQARAGDRIVIRSGTYREPPIRVTMRVEIIAEGAPVFEGGAHSTMEVLADSVVVRGLTFAGVEASYGEDRAAIRIGRSRGCRIEQNIIRDAFFGISVVEATGCVIAGNWIEGPAGGGAGALSGNGIHLWKANALVIQDNTVRRHRDGIYFEFARQALVRNNTSSDNRRYGLHFMRSDSCTYTGNRFERNGAGVAVMYSRGVTMRDNRFVHNWGSAAYGLLLKDISDGIVERNRFEANTTGLYLEDSNRNRIRGNDFVANGWAIRVLANSADNRFEGNAFSRNSFDVATNSRIATSTFRENWWDQYRGYDLDRDGYGDVPHRPVRLFSLVVERSEPSLILLRSAFLDLLDGAERLMPMLTPETLADARPLMRRPR